MRATKGIRYGDKYYKQEVLEEIAKDYEEQGSLYVANKWGVKDATYSGCFKAALEKKLGRPIKIKRKDTLCMGGEEYTSKEVSSILDTVKEYGVKYASEVWGIDNLGKYLGRMCALVGMNKADIDNRVGKSDFVAPYVLINGTKIDREDAVKTLREMHSIGLYKYAIIHKLSIEDAQFIERRLATYLDDKRVRRNIRIYGVNYSMEQAEEIAKDIESKGYGYTSLKWGMPRDKMKEVRKAIIYGLGREINVPRKMEIKNNGLDIDTSILTHLIMYGYEATARQYDKSIEELKKMVDNANTKYDLSIKAKE